MLENEKIKNIRTQLGLTQQEMADCIGVSKQYLSKVEKGHTDLSKERFVNLCLNYNDHLIGYFLIKGKSFLAILMMNFPVKYLQKKLKMCSNLMLQ